MTQRAPAASEFARESGVALTLGPWVALLGPSVLVDWLADQSWAASYRALLVHSMYAVGAALTLSGVALAVVPRQGRWLFMSAVLALAGLAAAGSGFSPTFGLVIGALCIAVWHWLWPARVSSLPLGYAPGVSRARAAAGALSLALVTLLLSGRQPGVFGLSAILISSGISALLVVLALLVERPRRRLALVIGTGLFALTLLGASLAALGRFEVRQAAWFGLPALVSAATLLRQGGQGQRLLAAMVDGVASHPARLLAVTFLGLCVFGTALLKLPAASATEQPLSLIQAGFTATSAVCVTGLVVLDTPVAFSPLGQGLVLLLIQVGGLGIMSFSTVIAAALGRRLSLRHEAAMADLLLSENRGELSLTLKRLLGVTFLTELAGAACLFPLFLRGGDDVGMALWRAVFTSISAFCNAGFALQSQSLIPYANSAAVLHVVAALIILGGLSPFVVLELPRVVRRRSVSLQSRLVLVATAALLASGAVVIGALEWSHGFAHLTFWERLNAAWFQSVTLRTAGFNSVDFEALRPATLWVMCAYMFIGGSPGGTAGGIKTTTAAALLIAVGGAMRGRWEAIAFGRRLSNHTIYKAAAITTIALGFVVAGVVALSVTQDLEFMPMLFEVVSALGTVGLSAGVTGKLDQVGQVIIMFYMFIGRVGPLTLFLFLRERDLMGGWHVPEEDVDVG